MLPIQALLSLPVLSLAMQIARNEDWLDSVGYVTDLTSNTPIPLDGILLTWTVRNSEEDIGTLLYATTSNGLINILPATQGSAVNSVWMLAIFKESFPAFLPVGSFVTELQGIVGNYTKTLVSGTVVVNKGVTA